MVIDMKFGINLPRSFFEILKSQKTSKNGLVKFIPNFTCKHHFEESPRKS